MSVFGTLKFKSIQERTVKKTIGISDYVQTGLKIAKSDMPNPNYKNILQLDERLTNAKIPHELVQSFDGWIICYPDSKNKIADVVTHFDSCGHEQDLMEAFGFAECVGDIIPSLSINDAFELFKNAYEQDRKEKTE